MEEKPMTIDQAKTHFAAMLKQLRNMEPSPWPFLCAAAMLEYLAKMTTISGRERYIQFIKAYMKSEYRDFRFKDGKQNLPEQIYYVLRCGLVHSFSLTPDVAYFRVGRNESIIIAYEGHHLFACVGEGSHYTDAVCLVFKDFVDDIEAALNKLFGDAQKNPKLLASICAHLKSNPPVEGLTSRIIPLRFPASTITHSASGSTHP
jgi:hypothetical protein